MCWSLVSCVNGYKLAIFLLYCGATNTHHLIQVHQVHQDQQVRIPRELPTHPSILNINLNYIIRECVTHNVFLSSLMNTCGATYFHQVIEVHQVSIHNHY